MTDEELQERIPRRSASYTEQRNPVVGTPGLFPYLSEPSAKGGCGDRFEVLILGLSQNRHRKLTASFLKCQIFEQQNFRTNFYSHLDYSISHLDTVFNQMYCLRIMP